MTKLFVDSKFYSDLLSVRIFFVEHSSKFGKHPISVVDEITKEVNLASSGNMRITFYASVRTRLEYLQNLLFVLVDSDEQARFVHIEKVKEVIQLMLNNLVFVERDDAMRPDSSQRLVTPATIQGDDIVYPHQLDLAQAFDKLRIAVRVKRKGFGK